MGQAITCPRSPQLRLQAGTRGKNGQMQMRAPLSISRPDDGADESGGAREACGAGKHRSAEKEQRPLPQLQRARGQNAVLCTQCGYNRKTNKQFQAAAAVPYVWPVRERQRQSADPNQSGENRRRHRRTARAGRRRMVHLPIHGRPARDRSCPPANSANPGRRPRSTRRHHRALDPAGRRRRIHRFRRPSPPRSQPRPPRPRRPRKGHP